MWSQISETMGLLMKTLDEIYKALGDVYAEGHENVQDVMGTLSNLMRRMGEAEAASSGMMHKPSNDSIYWVEVNPRGERLSLNAAPLQLPGQARARNSAPSLCAQAMAHSPVRPSLLTTAGNAWLPDSRRRERPQPSPWSSLALPIIPAGPCCRTSA